MAAGIKGLDADFNIESLFPRDDGKLLTFKDYTARFGRDDDLLLLLCETENLEKETFVRSLDKLGGDLKSLGLFSGVFSFLDAPHIWLSDDIELGIGPLRDWVLAHGTFYPQRMNSLIASLTPDGPVLYNFLSPASQTAILLLRLSDRYVENQGRLVATARLHEWLAKQHIPEITRFTLSGMPAARADGMRMIQRDQGRLLPLSLLLAMFMLFCSFGRFRDVGLVMAHIMMTLIITLGSMGHLGLKFSILSSVTPIILVTIGSSYSIQILSRLRRLQALYKNVPLEDLFASMIGPVFLANITTVVGFFSLFNTNMQLINEFAAITAGGVFITFVLTVTVFPLMVDLFSGAILPETTRKKSKFFQRLILRFGYCVTQRPRQIFWGLIMFGAATVYYSSFVQIRAFVFDDFRPDCFLMRHIRKAEQICNGILPMSVMIVSTKNEAILRLHFFQKAARVAEFLRSQPEVGKVDSPSDALGKMFRLLTENTTDPASLPPNDATLAELIRLFLVGGNIDPGTRSVSADLSALQIQFRIKDIESGKAALFIDRVRSFLRTLDDERANLQLSGTTLMIQETFRNILGSLVLSFVFVILFTIPLLMFNFRHLPSLLVGCLGNLIPLTAVIGLMGVLDISFKPSTTMIFGIVLGLAVDNTIYFMKEYWRHCSADRSKKRIVIMALRKAAEGMIRSSFSLFFGFFVLLFSEFEAQYLIGLLLSFSVGVALIFDLFFVPAGLYLCGPQSITCNRSNGLYADLP